LWDRLAGNGERGGVRRVAVDNALHVGPLLVDFQVQQGFARPLLAAGELLARHIDEADVVRLEEALAVHRRCAEDFVLADADGDIAIVGGREALVVEPATDLADILFDFVVVDHLNSLAE
jgi:hypothetical protein